MALLPGTRVHLGTAGWAQSVCVHLLARATAANTFGPLVLDFVIGSRLKLGVLGGFLGSDPLSG